jgi:hypothetical protein
LPKVGTSTTASKPVGKPDAGNPRLEGLYLVILGQNPPEIAYWERGEWWLAVDPWPWQPEAVTVVSDRLVFKPRLAPVVSYCLANSAALR